MTTVYRWIKCATPGCDNKHAGYYTPGFDFLAEATTAGWVGTHCPTCATPDTDGPATERILVVPLTHGAFTAYAPDTMTPADWATVAAVCNAMATQTDG